MSEAMEEKALNNLADDLSALSSVQRLRLLHLLTRPRYAEEIAESLGMSRQSALKHLERLQERHFIRSFHGRRATGPVIEYLVVPARLFALGIAIGEMGKLEPAGGPAVRVAENTVVFNGDAPPAPVRQHAARLLVIDGPAAGTEIPLEGGLRWTMGRDGDRDVQVKHDPYVSGWHAEVQEDATGHAIVDVFSSNGTMLNFARIPRGGRVSLRAGDVIGVGHTHIVYQRG